MIYEKNGIKMENTNPVCDSLFVKQGWVPVKEEVMKKDKTEPDTAKPEEKPVSKKAIKTNK